MRFMQGDNKEQEGFREIYCMTNSVGNFIKKELSGWGQVERIIFPLEIIFIIILSVIVKDNLVATISAIFGISYTILAGKGKISCYFFGLAGTLCYSYISFKNALFGNLALYMCYYFPMEIYGIFNWKKHLNKDTQEIIKTKLTPKKCLLYFAAAIILTCICYFVLLKLNDKNPLCDSVTSVFSVFGLLFTVKRYIEQWYIWMIVNGLSVIMWIQAYVNGFNCLATVLMWLTYFILSFYFFFEWKKELNNPAD